MSYSVELPVEYDRSFSLYLYWISHGLLLLRSGQTAQHPTRLDILFGDVRWMALPVWFDGLHIERGTPDDLPLPLTDKIAKEAHFMSVFRLVSQGVSHCVLAAENVWVAEDQEPYHANSALLPDYDLRAFTAPLRRPA